MPNGAAFEFFVFGSLCTCRLWIARVFPWIVSIPENEEQLKEKWDSTIAAYLAAVDIT